MANYETVIYEKAEDKIYRLTLNRPEKLNALSQKLLKELDSVMDEYESNADASVLIIRRARSRPAPFCKAPSIPARPSPSPTTGSGSTKRSSDGSGCGPSTNPRSRRCMATA